MCRYSGDILAQNTVFNGTLSKIHCTAATGAAAAAVGTSADKEIHG